MSGDSAFGDRVLSTRNAFEHGHALLHELIALDVHEVRARQAVLRYENRLLVSFDVREQFGCLPLQRGNKLGSHEVILKYHSCDGKRFSVRATAW